jgi:hypothetical protein
MLDSLVKRFQAATEELNVDALPAVSAIVTAASTPTDLAGAQKAARQLWNIAIGRRREGRSTPKQLFPLRFFCCELLGAASAAKGPLEGEDALHLCRFRAKTGEIALRLRDLDRAGMLLSGALELLDAARARAGPVADDLAFNVHQSWAHLAFEVRVPPSLVGKFVMLLCWEVNAADVRLLLRQSGAKSFRSISMQCKRCWSSCRQKRTVWRHCVSRSGLRCSPGSFAQLLPS